jgi:hypothetical protein
MNEIELDRNWRPHPCNTIQEYLQIAFGELAQGDVYAFRGLTGRVPALVGQWKLWDMAVRSLLEGLVGEGIGHLVEERLMVWVSTAQSEHSDARMIQEDFAADESMGPQAIDRPGAAEELHPALFVGAAEVDHTAGGWALEVQIPVLRKRSVGPERVRSGRLA